MKYTILGNSDLEVSELCLGCMSFGEADRGQYGWTLDQEASTEIIRRAYECGINFFDTSNNYSGGTSEIFLGKAIKEFDRRDLVIATKYYFNEGRLSPEAIHREVIGSLKRLDTPYIDLLILHRYDYDTPVEDTLKALDEEVKSGRIRYYGASAMYGHQFAEYCYKARELGYRPFVTLQNHYSPIYREDERDLIPVAERIYELSLKYDVPMNAVALNWQFIKGVASPIIGITKMKYLDDALKVFDFELSDEETAFIDELYVPHPITCNR